MKKTVLSIGIIALAMMIVVMNLWKPAEQNENGETEEMQPVAEEAAVNSTIPAEPAEIGIQQGNAAPDFELATLDGNTVKLSDFKGKKVILNFWATWCPPCKAEMPHMQNFYEENKDEGIEIVAVNLTNLDKGRNTIETFIEDYGLTFTIPLDEDGKIGETYQTFSIPTSYILDADGIIKSKIIGPMDEEMMTSLTKDL